MAKTTVKTFKGYDTTQTTIEDGNLKVVEDYNIFGMPMTNVTQWGPGGVLTYFGTIARDQYGNGGHSSIYGGGASPWYPLGMQGIQTITGEVAESALVQGF